MKNKFFLFIVVGVSVVTNVAYAQYGACNERFFENDINTQILPVHLQSGDTVGLVASASRATTDEKIQKAKKNLESLGLRVKEGKSIFKYYGDFAGTDIERANDLNDMFKDPEIKAIFEVRGGWGCNKILPLLDYELIKNNPKIIIGFSDITSLLLAIHSKTGLVTFHGTIGAYEWPEFTVNYMRRVLFDAEKVKFSNPGQTNIRIINSGITKGRLIGGNLSLIASMIGSEYLPHWEGAILFIEDDGEKYYRIDRMMYQLKMAGVLDKISGFIFGYCTDCTPSTDRSRNLDEILDEYIKPLKIPAWSGAMIGHVPNMFTLPEGSLVEINADQGTINMLEAAVI